MHELLKEHVEAMSSLQRLHLASDRHALLLILQGMDSAGKDGAIRAVMSGVNPQGCETTPKRRAELKSIRSCSQSNTHTAFRIDASKPATTQPVELLRRVEEIERNYHHGNKRNYPYRGQGNKSGVLEPLFCRNRKFI